MTELSSSPLDAVEILTGPGFSLEQTVAPVAWGGGRWPNQDWRNGQFISVGMEGGTVVRTVTQADPDSNRLALTTNRPDLDHQAWAERVLGVRRLAPTIGDPVVAGIAGRYPGMRPFSNESLFDGIVTAIMGQSISVQAAAVTGRKLAALFAEPVAYGHRLYWPLPSAEQLAEAGAETVRRSGVTQRRADAIVAIARMAAENRLVPPEVDLRDEQSVYQAVMRLPHVGRWTAESVLLWGLGTDDAYPAGDVALLRAARLAYGRPGLTHAEMDSLSEAWRPGRAWAARWLWLDLFGPAPLVGPRE